MSELCRSHRCAADEIVDHSDPGHRCSCECGFTWKWEKADAIVLPEVTPAAMFAVLVEKSAQIAEMERQRDAVLALHQPMPHDPTRCGICHQADQSCGCCGSWDENDRWPCKTVEIYGGGQ